MCFNRVKMDNFFSLLIILFFVCLFIVNFYFKRNVVKYHKILARNKIYLGPRQLFNPSFLEEEIIPNHTSLENEIRAYSVHFRRAIFLGAFLFGGLIILAVTKSLLL